MEIGRKRPREGLRCCLSLERDSKKIAPQIRCEINHVEYLNCITSADNSCTLAQLPKVKQRVKDILKVGREDELTLRPLMLTLKMPRTDKPTDFTE